MTEVSMKIIRMASLLGNMGMTYFDVGASFLQFAGDACDCAACACSYHHHVQFTCI